MSRMAKHCNIFILPLHLQSQRSTSTWETVAVVPTPHCLALIKVVLCVFLEKQMSCGRTRTRTGTWKKRFRLLQSFPSDCFGPPHRCRNDVIIWSPTWNCLLEFFGCLPPSPNFRVRRALSNSDGQSLLLSLFVIPQICPSFFSS